MSAEYSDDEVEAAVEKIVRSAIRRPYGSLGQRAVGTTFTDFQEQTIAVLTLTPNAPFYVVLLGTERLVTNIADVAGTLDDLDDVAQALGRSPTAVSSTTALANARVAADALAISAGVRTQAYPDISKTPAFQRLDRNIQAFLDTYSSPNMKRGGVVVRTPEEAKTMLPGLIQQLKDQRATLIALCTSLAGAMANYAALNLPGLLSTGVVQRASQVLAMRTAQLETLTPETRVSIIRDVTLDLLAARAIIRNFGSLAVPTTFLILSGMGVTYADATHPATPAMLVADKPGPYPIRSDSTVENQLNLLIDGTFSTVVTTAGSFIAELQGIALEPFAIIDSSDPEQNDTLEVFVDELGVTTNLVVTFTPGFRSAQQIVTDILAAITTQPLTAEPALIPTKFQGSMDISGADPSAITFTSTNPFTDFVRIGVKDGDKLHVLTGANEGVFYQVNASGVSGAMLTCTRITGSTTTLELAQVAEVGGASLGVRIKLLDSYGDTALARRTKITIGTTDDVIKTRTAATLGFSAGIFATSAPVPAQTVADAINAATTTTTPTATGSMSRLTAALTTKPVTLTSPVSVLQDMLFRSDTTDPASIVVYALRTRATIPAGTTCVFVVPGVSRVALTDLGFLIIRSSPVAADVNVRGTIDMVTPATDTVTVTFDVGITGGSNLFVELVPDLTTLPFDTLVVIPTGPNAGSYRVTGQGAINVELAIDKALRSYIDTSGQNILMTGSIVQEYLTLTSTDTTLASAIQVSEGSPTNPFSAAALFFNALPTNKIGTTPWFQLPDGSQGMEVGDYLQLFTTNAVTPTLTCTITAIDGELISVVNELPSNEGSFILDVGGALPFARIRKARQDNFDIFRGDMTDVLSLPPFQPAWLTELDRLVTVVTIEPTPTSVNNLRKFFFALLAVLTKAGEDQFGNVLNLNIEAIAAAYTAPVIPEVDALIEALLAKGGDRAIDLLLAGLFGDYFGLTVDTVSYAGTVAAATRDVIRQDMPIRSTRRSELTNRQISMGQTTDADYEYDQSDIDNSLVPDSPGPNPPPKPGDAF